VLDCEPSPLGQLIYLSSARILFSEEELLELLQQSREFNQAHDITGILIYRNGTFLQVLEGHPDTIARLYYRIERDPRHHRCLLLLRQNIAERAFEGWVMGFPATSSAAVESTDGYIDFFSHCPVPDHGAPAYRLLSSFFKQQERFAGLHD
jgi:hypothetical protein